MSDGIRILRRGSGCDGEDYLEVQYTSARKRHVHLFALRDLSSATSSRKIGILTPTSRNSFATQAETAIRDMPSTFCVADRSGWFDNATFIWPDGERSDAANAKGNGEGTVSVCLSPEYRNADRVYYRGGLKAWREVTELAKSNSRVMLVIAHAFSGPVVDFLEIDAPAIQLVGEAGVFKTTIASVTADMWGIRTKSWHGTSNSIEEVALCHHATYLVLLRGQGT